MLEKIPKIPEKEITIYDCWEKPTEKSKETYTKVNKNVNTTKNTNTDLSTETSERSCEE